MISQFLLICKIKSLQKTNYRWIHKNMSPQNNSFNCKNLSPQKFLQINCCHRSMYVCVSIWVSVNFYTSFNLWIRSKDFFWNFVPLWGTVSRENGLGEISQNTPSLGQMNSFTQIVTENCYLKFLSWL